jgi:high-affinity nickel permease
VGSLDRWLAGNAHGAPLLVVIGLATLLGLRHASDPDHLAAVTSLIAGEDERRVRRAASLGLAWGLGHATTLALCGCRWCSGAATCRSP